MTATRGAGALGPYDGSEFVIVAGREALAASAAAAWYFADECVAVPAAGAAVAAYAEHTRPLDDVRRWSDAQARAPRELPPLVWIGAPDTLRHARVDLGTASVALGERTLALTLADRLPQNASWPDGSTADWLVAREVALRGTLAGTTFRARTLWPEAFRVGPLATARRSLPDGGTPGERLRNYVRAPLRADAPFDAATVWQRGGDARWSGRSVIALVLSGAQGDDDEAHAGHLAVATGRIAADGSIAGWLVNNFYSLDSVSEKGILAAPVPLDAFLGDLNAGQSWYRPNWLVVAVLDDDRAALRVQSAFARLFRQFWRHQLRYYHPTDNCTSISVDTLRALGLDIAERGPTLRVLAPLAFPMLVLRQRSLARGAIDYDYAVTERTRLLPAVAVEAVFDSLVALAERRAAPAGRLAREIAEDLSALAVVRIPQFPSSRAFGAPPVASLAEYRRRIPRDPAHLRIIPLAPRPFPETLRDADLLPPRPHPSQLALRGWLFVPLALIALALIVVVR